MNWFLPMLRPRTKAKIEYGVDFISERTNFSGNDIKLIDEICNELGKKPDSPADQEFARSAVGVMKLRSNSGVYVLYQLFLNDPPPPPFRLKFWYCGRYVDRGGRKVYDFE